MIGDVTGNTNSNYSADNIDLNVDLQGSSNQLTFRFGNKSETYNTPNNLGDGCSLTTVGFQTYLNIPLQMETLHNMVHTVVHVVVLLYKQLWFIFHTGIVGT